MLSEKSQIHRTLARALEVAIAAEALPATAKTWGQTVLLEAMAEVMGIARNTLRNLYYRKDPRLEVLLQAYVATSREHVMSGLKDLQFRRFSPLVWKRPQAELKASRQGLPGTVILAQAAEKIMRETLAPPMDLRREVGTVAAEIMASALTFYDGQQRWELLVDGEQLFRSAMGPLALEHEVNSEDAALFARYWENRATRPGLEWSNVWDDPNIPPTIGMDVVNLAIEELDHAASWMKKYTGRAAVGNESDRVRQLLADKAKWLAKAGEFAQARRHLDELSAFNTVSARSDALLVRTLEQITSNQLAEASATGTELADLIGQHAEPDALTPVTAAIMLHNIELLRGRRPPISPEIEQFLTESPVAASELVNLPRYRERLAELGYSIPEAALARA